MKKTLLLLAGLSLVFGATSLWANTDWHGKFWSETREGEWKGTLIDIVDPPRFEGEYSDGEDAGKCIAELEYEGHGIYKITKGVIYNSDGYVIGKFTGYFDVNIKPGKAEGKWELVWGEFGYWEGKRILP